MGLRLQRHVLNSKLPRPLRFLALVLALVAHDRDPVNVFPRVETLAEYLGVDKRHVRRGLAALRALGVLVVVEQGGGRRHATRCRFNADALPTRAASVTRTNGDAVSDGKEVFAEPEEVSGCSGKSRTSLGPSQPECQRIPSPPPSRSAKRR
jgi:Helix-turn-helix domain